MVVYPFLTMVNFMCAAVILALAAIDDAAALRRSSWLVIAAFLLASPAMILTDEAGISTGLFWCDHGGGCARDDRRHESCDATHALAWATCAGRDDADSKRLGAPRFRPRNLRSELRLAWERRSHSAGAGYLASC